MRGERIVTWVLRGYLVMVFCFIFAPIVTSVIFSFNSDRFPTIPLGSFTLKWYQTILADPGVWDAAKNSIIVALLTATLWCLIRKPWLGFLGLWFFLILAPTSSFIPIKDMMFEHRMYLPLAAIVVLLVVGGCCALSGLAVRLSPGRVSSAGHVRPRA